MIASSCLNEHLEDVPCQRLFYFLVAWNRLADSGLGILLPIVPFAGPDEDATVFLDPADQIAALHGSCNSPTLLPSGIVPAVSSA